MPQMNRILLVALLGAAGTLARFGLGDAFPRTTPHAMPWGTLIANLIGSMLLGALYSLPASTLSGTWRVALGVGALGGLTTFSTLMWETTQIWNDGAGVRATTYLVGSIALGLVGVSCGAALARVSN